MRHQYVVVEKVGNKLVNLCAGKGIGFFLFGENIGTLSFKQAQILRENLAETHCGEFHVAMVG